MKKSTRRYLFLEFEDLKNIKFRKLEKVCDRLFVFIRKEEKHLPVELVQKMQRFGRNAKWVVIEGLDITQNMSHHITFFMGKLHERVDTEIEFAVLSNESEFDPLINYVNVKGGRSCLRVKGKARQDMNRRPERIRPSEPAPANYTLSDEMRTEEEINAYTEPPSPRSTEPPIMVSSGYDDDFLKSDEPVVRSVTGNYTVLSNGESSYRTEENNFDDDKIIQRTAEETVSRLVRSGNRPALLSTLKNYILLHNQELTVHGNIDAIIKYMEEDGQIEVEEDEVVYLF